MVTVSLVHPSANIIESGSQHLQSSSFYNSANEPRKCSADELTSNKKKKANAKLKRIRTKFKPSQLDLLHNCFRVTHKPSNNELRQLINRTGLAKRVLQVRIQLLNDPHPAIQCLYNLFISRFGFKINAQNGFEPCFVGVFVVHRSCPNVLV